MEGLNADVNAAAHATWRDVASLVLLGVLTEEQIVYSGEGGQFGESTPHTLILPQKLDRRLGLSCL